MEFATLCEFATWLYDLDHPEEWIYFAHNECWYDVDNRVNANALTDSMRRCGIPGTAIYCCGLIFVEGIGV